MKLIIYSCNSFNADLLKKHLILAGHEVTTLEQSFTDYTFDAPLIQKLLFLINSSKADAVVSFNYYPFVALACNTCQISYYSWVYDSPHLTLFSKTIYYPTNHVGIFDKEMALQLKDVGINSVHHLPLAVDVDELDVRIRNASDSIKAIPEIDVSFVGSLYTEYDKNNMFDLFQQENTDDKKSWIKAINIIKNIQFKSISSLSEEDYTFIHLFLKNKALDKDIFLDDKYISADDYIIDECIINKKKTVEERCSLFTAVEKYCSNSNHNFSLFTNSKTVGPLSNVNKGPINYINEMPYVFNKSKINLNCTLSSIASGIPLRVLDILGSGGFLLTNPQEELYDYFEEGKHFEAFRSVEECVDKIGFYLSHDDVRKAIAKEAKLQVSKCFKYSNALNKLLNS